MNGRIHMKNMVFYGHHGDIPEERVLGQRFIIDLAVTLDLSEVAKSDELRHTVNYVGVYDLCRQLLEKEPLNLLETVAARLSERILAANPRIQVVEILVKKPSVPIRGALDYVAVELTLARENGISRSGQ